MAKLPSASTSVSVTAGAGSGGTDVVCIIAPVKTAADGQARQFGAASAIYAMHDYSEGVEYAALHGEKTKKPFIFCGVPIASAGVIGRLDKSGNSGSSVCTVTAGGSGCLTEHDGVIKVVTGGTVGTDQILLEYSLDGGTSYKKLRIGTGNSYTFPFVGASFSLGAGTLVAGDTIATWSGTGPKADAAGLQTAFDALGGQQKLFRSVLLCGDLVNSTEAQAFLDKVNAYETSKKRFVYGRAAVYDRLPLATMSQDVVRMTGTPALTFAEVGASGDTITRATGSWLADGFVQGDTIVIAGSASNNITAVIASLSATVITLGTEDLAAEVTSAATVVGYPTLTFAEVGASGDTITRNRGSWVADGFRVGDKIVVTGSASNNITAAQGLAAVTPTVLTLGTDDLVAEVIRTALVTLVAGQTKAAWMAQIDAAFAAIDGATAMRIDLAAGRGRVLSPFSSWFFRRSPAWAASLREYQHDLHVPPWRKKDGNTGFSLLDTEGKLVEWDDDVDGGAGSAARFTTFRSWGNGPGGAFIARSLTRAGDGNLLANTHNVAVLDLAMTITQTMTENFVGRTPQLKDDGTATSDELKTLESEVNAELDVQLLTSRGEGPRASKAVWTADTDDILNIDDAELNGTLDLNLNGTIVSVRTVVRVRSGGQG